MLAVRIAAAFHGAPTDEVHAPGEDPCQTFLPIHPFEQAAFDSRPDAGQQIHVAIRVEIVPQGGAEQLQACDSAFLAKLPHRFGIKFQLHFSECYRRNVALPRAVLAVP